MAAEPTKDEVAEVPFADASTNPDLSREPSIEETPAGTFDERTSGQVPWEETQAEAEAADEVEAPKAVKSAPKKKSKK